MVITTEKLLRIYKAVKVKSRPKPKPKYPPARKSYNILTFG